MKMKNVILLMAMMIGLLSANAQSNNPFVGVWEHTNNGKGTSVLAIKITEKGDGLLVQLKRKNGIVKQEISMPSGNVIEVNFDDGVEYGKWKIGSWNGEEDHILECKDNGHYGTYGPASTINSRMATANVERSFWGYRICLDEECIKLYEKCWSTYYNGNRELFSQATRWLECGEYTNW